MLPAAAVELLMHQDPPIGVRRHGLPLRNQHPSCRAIHQRQLRNAEGIKVWRQARDRASSGTQLCCPQGRKPGHKQKQHQSQWQCRRKQLQAALQNTTEREGTGQLMAQQTGGASNTASSWRQLAHKICSCAANR